MKPTVTDSIFYAVVQYGILNFAEYHALILGILCGLICFFIKSLDERIAAMSLAFCTIVGLIQPVDLTYVVDKKPWYYLTGLIIPLGLSYLFIFFTRNFNRIYGIVSDGREKI